MTGTGSDGARSSMLDVCICLIYNLHLVAGIVCVSGFDESGVVMVKFEGLG